MPQSLHYRLVQAAETRETSLNSFIIGSLTRAVGASRGEEGTVRDPNGKHLGSVTSEPRRVPRAMFVNLIVMGFAGIAAVILLILAWPAAW